jgi:hypothetical protein
MGVKLRLVQYPCRSGWPSGVRVTVQAFVFAALVFAAVAFAAAVVGAAGGAWAARNVGAKNTLAIAIVRTTDEIQERAVM